MRTFSVIILIATSALFAGCGRGSKEVSSVNRAKAVQLATDAQLSAKLGDYAQAAELLTSATELDPDIPGYWAGLGNNRLRTGDLAAARKACQRLLAIQEAAEKKSPKDSEIRLRQIETLVMLNRRDDARKLLERTLKDFPGDNAVRSLKESKEIEQYYTLEQVRAAQLAGDAEQAARALDYAKAATCLGQATGLDPENPSYWSGLAVNRMRNNDKSGARKAIERALAIHESLEKKTPGEPDHLLGQIEPLVLLNRAGDARKVLQRALKAFPTDPNVRAFNDARVVDQMIQDPAIKALML